MPSVITQPCAAATIGLVHGVPSLRHGSRRRREREVAAGQTGRHLGEVEAAGEMLAVRVQDAGAQLVVALELGVGVGELVQQRQVEGVALVRAVQADQQHVPVALQ